MALTAEVYLIGGPGNPDRVTKNTRRVLRQTGAPETQRWQQNTPALIFDRRHDRPGLHQRQGVQAW